MGAHRRVDRLEVRWLGGRTDVLTDIAADQAITVTEGDSPSGTDETQR